MWFPFYLEKEATNYGFLFKLALLFDIIFQKKLLLVNSYVTDDTEWLLLEVYSSLWKSHA